MDTKTLSVLVIEDDEFLVNAYRTKLTKDGFDVHFAADGQEAMKTLETLHPNVILLDLMLPNKDGFAVLEEIKKLSSLSKIPVIVAYPNRLILCLLSQGNKMSIHLLLVANKLKMKSARISLMILESLGFHKQFP
jgi:CheY-like chemotaxis protein